MMMEIWAGEQQAIKTIPLGAEERKLTRKEEAEARPVPLPGLGPGVALLSDYQGPAK